MVKGSGFRIWLMGLGFRVWGAVFGVFRRVPLRWFKGAYKGSLMGLIQSDCLRGF